VASVIVWLSSGGHGGLKLYNCPFSFKEKVLRVLPKCEINKMDGEEKALERY